MSTNIDLYAGLAGLLAAYESNRDRVISVRYEDLLTTQSEWKRIFDYLGLSFDPKVLTQLNSIQLGGRMGDPTGTKRYAEMSREPLEKWRDDYYNPIRVWWARRYLRWLGRERLLLMGYEIDQIVASLAQCRMSLRGVDSDLAGMARDILATWVEPFIVIPKLKDLFARKRRYVHR